MLRWGRPSGEAIARHLATQAGLAFSYEPVGVTRRAPPPGWTVDDDRVAIGAGAAEFQLARDAVRAWAMFRLGWLELEPPAPAIRVGTTVAVLIHGLGVWWLNACRIVYVVEETGPVERFGFAYGTLPDHAATGEERFTVAWNHADDHVVYERLAFSRPHALLARIGYPAARHLQHRFGRDSARAMEAAVRGA